MPSNNLLGWTDGPLPNQELEHIAWMLFTYRYPEVDYDSSLFSAERNDCRRLAMQLRAKFIKMQRWTLGTMHERLEEGFARIVFGDRGPTAAEQKLLTDYAAACIADLFSIFTGDARAKGPSDSQPDDSDDINPTIN